MTFSPYRTALGDCKKILSLNFFHADGGVHEGRTQGPGPLPHPLPPPITTRPIAYSQSQSTSMGKACFLFLVRNNVINKPSVSQYYSSTSSRRALLSISSIRVGIVKNLTIRFDFNSLCHNLIQYQFDSVLI